MKCNDRFGLKLSENLFVSVCTLHRDLRSLFAVTFPLRISLSFIVCTLLVWSSCKTIPFSPVFSMEILSSFRSLHFHSLYTLSVDSLFVILTALPIIRSHEANHAKVLSRQQSRCRSGGNCNFSMKKREFIGTVKVHDVGRFWSGSRRIIPMHGQMDSPLSGSRGRPSRS